MPRRGRYFIPNIPQHVITRGVERQAVFFHEQDYSLYLEALQEAAATNNCLIHAYVLMTNHVHLLVTPGRERSLPLMMQAMGRTAYRIIGSHLSIYMYIDGDALSPEPGIFDAHQTLFA
jgi:putative transposase